VQHSDAEQPAAEHAISADVELMPLVSPEQSKAAASEAAALMFAQVGGIVVGMTVQHSVAEQPAAEHAMPAGVASMSLVSEAQSKAAASEAAALMFAQVG
jgi:hypothetical protein